MKLDERMIEMLHQRIGQAGQLSMGEKLRQKQRGESQEDTVKKALIQMILKDKQLKEGADVSGMDFAGGNVLGQLGGITEPTADAGKLKQLMEMQKLQRESGEARTFELGAGLEPTSEELAPYTQDVLGQERFRRPVATMGGRTPTYGQTIQAQPEIQTGAREALMGQVGKKIKSITARKQAGKLTEEKSGITTIKYLDKLSDYDSKEEALQDLELYKGSMIKQGVDPEGIRRAINIKFPETSKRKGWFGGR